MSNQANQVRIIAGQWRGRKLNFPSIDGLRPTADRIRETLFNWLAPVISGSVCLDLYAGSGALGFEAVSRGARRVVMVERHKRVLASLQENCARLNAGQVEVVASDVQNYLSSCIERFDIVFLDPPFSRPELIGEAIGQLAQCACLTSGAYVYVESAVKASAFDLPADWRQLKQKRAGAVEFRLFGVAE